MGDMQSLGNAKKSRIPEYLKYVAFIFKWTIYNMFVQMNLDATVALSKG